MELIRVKELSEFLKVKQSTIYSWVHNGTIPFIKLNGLLLFDMDEIMEWIENSKPIPPKANIPLKKTANMDIDSIVKNAIERVNGRSYNPSKRETSPSQGLRKED